MSSWVSTLRNSRWFDLVYKIGIGIKGFDGTVELTAGIVLWVSPGLLHELLASWHSSAIHMHGIVGQLLANSLDKANHELYGGTLVMAVVFLISHGVIKLTLVYALLKEILWAYPYALALLVLFLIVQVVAMIQSPGIGMAFLIVLDVFIIWLVYGEWQKLKSKHAVSKR